MKSPVFGHLIVPKLALSQIEPNSPFVRPGLGTVGEQRNFRFKLNLFGQVDDDELIGIGERSPNIKVEPNVISMSIDIVL